MEPIIDSGGDPEIFSVGHIDDGLWLGGRGQPDIFWYGRKFVFRRR